MGIEYKLPYTAVEIDKKLGQVDSLVEQIAGLQGSTSGGQAIIDVTELPTEKINEGAFYRLVSAQFVLNKKMYSDWTCYSVDSLPEIGEPVSTDMVNITSYYNVQDGVVYGYANENISATGGVPVGWYTIDVLGQAFDVPWSGVITHIDDDPEDSTFRVLLKYEFYVYKDGWMNVPFGYEQASAFDIQWNGEIGNKFALDMSALGYTDTYMVKMSDDVLTEEELIGATMTQNGGYLGVIDSSSLDTTTFAGAISIDGGGAVIVYSSDETNTALGLPAGYLTNGIYFAYMGNNGDPVYTNRLVAPTRVTKIDSKFIGVDTSALENLATVATTGNYNDLNNKPTIYTDVIRYNTTQSLSSTNKSRARTNIDVYSKSEVDNKIANSGSSVVTQPTTADNGKILQVVNGVATWTVVNIAEEASF